ncbi:MAG: DNA methyltransferase [Leptolyngbyaceae cyanobacterium bins.349]|nr:DNA methyltransferase [Leptolyngbyaceae cyanobacterium bins.349]
MTALEPIESASSVTPDRRSSELNQIRDCDRPVHDWYRFVLSFPPHLVQDYLYKFGIEPGQCVLDPFCGTGTTVVECKKQGIASVGVEANPMAQFAGTVKTNWSPEPATLIAGAERIAAISDRDWQAETPPRQLAAESARILLKHAKDKTSSISDLPLHKTLVLLEQIRLQAEPRYVHHLELALAKALVTSIGNLHFGPEVGVTKAKPDAPVTEAWLAQVYRIGKDLAQVQSHPSAPAQVHHADSRQIVQVLEPGSIDAVITSPPYPNEKDYTRTTRLESVILGFIQNKQELRALKEGLVRSNTRNVFKADTDDVWVSQHPDIQRIAIEIETRRLELGKTSGFERLYHRTVKHYFGGMAKHLADLRSILRPGARLAYVVGDQKSYLQVMIRTGSLLGELAEGLGYKLVDIELFRTRLSTATKEQMREEVVILQWPGAMPTTPYPFNDELRM